MKTREELKPNYAPVYCAVYPAFAKVFHEHGYALAVHGSVARDFDMIAVPWEPPLSPPDVVIAALEKKFAVQRCGEPERRFGGRYAYTLSIGHGECAVDLSFWPNLHHG